MFPCLSALRLSHSLGKLIEWKLDIVDNGIYYQLSHSLGKLIEWKQIRRMRSLDILNPFPLAGKIN